MNSLRNSTFLIGAIVILILSASFSFKKKKDPVYKAPGVIQIDEHLSIDQTEVTNFHWLEYIHWLKKIYGEESDEYKAALPDESLWQQEEEKHQGNEQYYFRHYAYKNYPVVGISYQQMVRYCEWRSDRVLEYMLIRAGKINYDTTQTPAHHFSIANYLNGNYGNYKTGEQLPPIPHYYLPSADEWERADHYAQSVYANMTKRQLKHNPSIYFNSLQANDATIPVSPTRKYEVKGALYNMHSNVSEQLADSSRVAGENWKRGMPLEEGETFFYSLTPSTCVGFRCAFQWK